MIEERQLKNKLAEDNGRIDFTADRPTPSNNKLSNPIKEPSIYSLTKEKI